MSDEQQERRKDLISAALIVLGICLFLATGILFLFAIAGATDDLGSTWSNSQAGELVPAMVVCVLAGVASFVGAWVVRRRR